MKERINIEDLDVTDLTGVGEALRRGQTEIASEILGEKLRRIDGPVPERPQEVPPVRKQEVEKKHIKRTGKR